MNTFLRLLSYILTRLTALAVITILIILAVFIGFDWANIYVISNEGLSQRAEIILGNKDVSELSKFYTQNFLDRDTLLSRHLYEEYEIGEFDQSIKIKKLWVLPWENKTKVTIEEKVTGIEGKNKTDGDEGKLIPPWENGEKVLIMEKDGRWKISDIIMIRPIKAEEKDLKDEDSK